MNSYVTNTLRYDEGLCSGCGLCSIVCPHRVFEPGERRARMVRPESCMECGACQLNCAPGAIKVRSGVGCASALFLSALLGRDETVCPCTGGGSAAGRGEAQACCCPDDGSHDEDGRNLNGEGRRPAEDPE
jgi:ferredoxin